MMRRNAAVLGLGVTLLVVVGCTQTCFVRECDYDEFHRRLELPRNLETAPEAAVGPLAVNGQEPATVNDPEREPHYLSLSEAIALALQQGYVGSQSLRGALASLAGGIGVASDDLVSFSGAGVVGSDSIRVLALRPALVSAGIERELARFDTQWTTSMAWNTTDEPTQGLSSFQNGQAATFSSSLAKPLPTGGVAGITFSNDYRLLATPPSGPFSVLSPSYTPRLQLGLEQPLLRGYGVETNQILPSLAGSNLFPVLGRRGGGGEGILIARVRFDQQRAEFERTVNFLLLNVEATYWNLYVAYVNLYSAEEAMRLAHRSWQISKARYDEGKIDLADFAPTRAQYEQFRGNRLQALGRVLEAERNLRILLGLTVEDGKRLVPSDAPTLAPYRPDWNTALEEALTLRPELTLARQELRTRQLNLAAQQNGLLPDLRFEATYTAVGLGSRLDGNGQFFEAGGTSRSNNALRSLASNHFNDWSIGLTLNMPLGFRAEHAIVRQAKLQLAQSYGVLKEQELKAHTFLARTYRELFEKHKVIEARRLERQAFAEQLEARFRKYAVGKITVDFLLDSQRAWAEALSKEYQAIGDYNIALAAFEFARGTLQRYDNVVIAEGPLPGCAAVRAADHERERTRAHVLRERAEGQALYPTGKMACGAPVLPEDRAPTLPALLSAPAPEEAPVPQVLPTPPAASRQPQRGAARLTTIEPASAPPPAPAQGTPAPKTSVPQPPRRTPVPQVLPPVAPAVQGQAGSAGFMPPLRVPPVVPPPSRPPQSVVTAPLQMEPALPPARLTVVVPEVRPPAPPPVRFGAPHENEPDLTATPRR